MARTGRPAKYPPIEFQGVRYYRKSARYYIRDPKCMPEGAERYLHRAVWVFHYGPIPKDSAIHHIDHDRYNNAISNLALFTRSEHASYHTRKRIRDGDPTILRGIVAAREAAKEWHRSDAGRAWHREHAKHTIATHVEPVEATCSHCGRAYTVDPRKKKRGFCSPACQSAARRASGVDNEERICAVCGETFTPNKYSKTITCGRRCGAILRTRNAACL